MVSRDLKHPRVLIVLGSIFRAFFTFTFHFFPCKLLPSLALLKLSRSVCVALIAANDLNCTLICSIIIQVCFLGSICMYVALWNVVKYNNSISMNIHWRLLNTHYNVSCKKKRNILLSLSKSDGEAVTPTSQQHNRVNLGRKRLIL